MLWPDGSSPGKRLSKRHRCSSLISQLSGHVLLNDGDLREEVTGPRMEKRKVQQHLLIHCLGLYIFLALTYKGHAGLRHFLQKLHDSRHCVHCLFSISAGLSFFKCPGWNVEFVMNNNRKKNKNVCVIFINNTRLKTA